MIPNCYKKSLVIKCSALRLATANCLMLVIAPMGKLVLLLPELFVFSVVHLFSSFTFSCRPIKDEQSDWGATKFNETFR